MLFDSLGVGSPADVLSVSLLHFPKCSHLTCLGALHLKKNKIKKKEREQELKFLHLMKLKFECMFLNSIMHICSMGFHT